MKQICETDETGDKYWFNERGEYHREDGPAIEFASGIKTWFFNGKRHRIDGPAIEFPNGTKYWYVNGKHHREDGPAIEHADGSKQWWFHDERIEASSQEEFERFLRLKMFL